MTAYRILCYSHLHIGYLMDTEDLTYGILRNLTGCFALQSVSVYQQNY